jgi:hypothetical protein
MHDAAGHGTWRVKVTGTLAGRPFGGIHLDVSPRSHELDDTDVVPLPNSLEFAGVRTRDVEIIEVHRHAAEKFHGMLKDFGERENSRVRDLVDLVILAEHQLLDPSKLATSVRRVWLERDGMEPPSALPSLPAGWPARYEAAATDHGLNIRSFPAAVALMGELWADMSPTQES